MATVKDPQTGSSYKVEDVFTPSIAPIYTFIEREEYKTWEPYMREHSRPICIEGPYQAGKTTLIEKLAAKAFPKGIIHVVCNKESTVDSIITEAFRRLRPFYETEIIQGRDTKEERIPRGYVERIFGCGDDQSSGEYATKRPVVPITPTSSVLAEFAASAERPLFIDDAHKLSLTEKERLAAVVREWQTQITPYGHPKIVIVSSEQVGATSLGLSLISFARDLASRLVIRHLPWMSASDLKKIIQLGGKLLNVDFSNVQDDILKFSIARGGQGSGRPGYVHDICRHVCMVAGVSETMAQTRIISREECRDGLGIWIDNCGDHIRAKFDVFFSDPPNNVPSGVYQQMCLLIYESGEQGLPLHELQKGLTEQFSSLSLGDCRSAIHAMTDPEEGLIRVDEKCSFVQFAEPLYFYVYARQRGAEDLQKAWNKADFIDNYLHVLTTAGAETPQVERNMG